MSDVIDHRNDEQPIDGDQCPECWWGVLEPRIHRFSTEGGPNIPDCAWLQCDSCDYHTPPE